jgi:hypothetical protein
MRKLLPIISLGVLVFLIAGSQALVVNQQPVFISSPADSVSQVGDAVTLIWELENANDLDYEIYMTNINVTDQLVDQDMVSDNEIRYRVDSPASGSYSFNVNVFGNGASIWSNVSIAFGIEPTSGSETTDIEPTPLWGWFMVFPLALIVRSRRSR